MVNLRAFSVFEPVPAVDCLEAGEDGSLFGAACDLRDPGERQQLAAIAAVRGHEHEAAAEGRHDPDVVHYEVVLLAALRDRTEECPCRRLCPPEWRRTAGRRPGELLLVLSHGHPAETLAVGLGPGV